MAGRTYWAEQLDEDPLPVVVPDRDEVEGAAVTLPAIEWSHVRDLVAPIDPRSLDHHRVGAGS